ERFDFLCNYGPFQCPENDHLSPPYSGSPIKITTKMVSYNTAAVFQYEYQKTPGDISRYQPFIDTGSYHPKVTSIGNSSRKIFLSDGARWSNGDNSAPDYNLGYDNSGDSPGGHYADFGPWSAFSRSFLRNKPMVLAMRHGARKPGLA